MDKFFRVKTLAATERPQTLAYLAMHQTHTDRFVGEIDALPDEKTCGERVVKHTLAGGRGHFGILEGPQISLAVGYFPHSVMQQARTHRVGVTFDCQSMRYTSKLFLDIAQDSSLDPERAFYLRPVGEYTDRQGKKYFYSEDLRMGDLACCIFAAKDYSAKLEAGMSEEHARGMLPFDYRQHFVVSFNLRSLMHFLDLRAKKDAQLEIQWLCDLLMIEFQNWAPEIASWYKANRLGKARLAP